MTVKIGKVKFQRKKTRGWLVSHFFPSGSPFKDNNVEIYYKTLVKKDFKDQLHFHPKGKEYLIVIKGNLTMQIDDDIVKLSKGDYICIKKGQKEVITEFEDKTELVGVRYPSVSNNKVFIDR